MARSLAQDVTNRIILHYAAILSYAPNIFRTYVLVHTHSEHPQALANSSPSHADCSTHKPTARPIERLTYPTALYL